MSIPSGETAAASYLLGHSREELLRLEVQARLLEPITRRFLLDAGILPGMRVLDVGCGLGDVTLLCAELAGRAGQVVGVDRANSAIAAARERARSKSVANVTFVEGNATDMHFEASFDAVVGRYVLMYQPDPVAMLRALARNLRAGGVIVFHELDWGGARSVPPAPTFDRCCRWVAEALQRGGAEAYMGTKLYASYVEAGLAAPMPAQKIGNSIPNRSQMDVCKVMADPVDRFPSSSLCSCAHVWQSRERPLSIA